MTLSSGSKGAEKTMAYKIEKIKDVLENVAGQNGHQLGAWQSTNGSWRITCYLCGHSAVVNENFGYSLEMTFRCTAAPLACSLDL
jgi:ankyrin repeat protein